MSRRPINLGVNEVQDLLSDAGYYHTRVLSVCGTIADFDPDRYATVLKIDLYDEDLTPEENLEYNVGIPLYVWYRPNGSIAVDF